MMYKTKTLNAKWAPCRILNVKTFIPVRSIPVVCVNTKGKTQILVYNCQHNSSILLELCWQLYTNTCVSFLNVEACGTWRNR
jgi:hypothetical protein